MKSSFYLPLLLILSILSCSQKKSGDKYQEAREIYDEAITVHDEVMPKMGTVINLQKSLRSEKENINNEEVLVEIDNTIEDLDDAHTSMMQWMRNLTSVPDESDADENIPPEEMTRIQKESLAEIRNVKNMINSSISEAETLLDKLNK